MKKVLYVVLLLIASKIASGQTSTSPSKVIPPSPTAASLGKYADWPVSLYTGTPSIDIPLYTLASKGVSVPISLNYHASGIKVEEDASWVGLGWSLNCGGVITRTVRGLPDDEPTFGYFSSRTLLPDPSKGYLNQANFIIFHQQAQGVIDTQPDVYMFNALGHSFKFFIDSNFQVQTIPKNSVKISNSVFLGLIPGTEQWTVQFEDGTTLYFGGAGCEERIDNTNGDGFYAGSGFISSWYLKKIVPVSGPEINFTYTPETFRRDNLVSMTDYLESPPEPGKSVEINMSTTMTYGLRLTQISSANALAKFIAHPTDRSDVPNSYALDSIKVYAMPSRRLIKQYKLNTIYPTSGRLRLDHITELATDNANQINQWSFVYNAADLPARGSYAQDHWGYYNGMNGNTTLLPAVDAFISTTHANADREAHFPYSAAESLEQINYPTGGYSKFTYEAHAYDDISTASTTSSSGNVTLNTTDAATTIKSTTIIVNSSQYATLDYTFTKDPNVGDPFYAIISLTNEGGGTPVFSKTPGTNGTYHEPVFVPAGTYNLAVVSNDMTNTYCSATLTWVPAVTPHTVSRQVGGLRLSSMVDFDGQNRVNKKNYVYSNAYCAAPIKNANYVNAYQEYHIDPCVPPSGGGSYINEILRYTARTSFSKAAVGTTGGGPIGYSHVTVVHGDGGTNGTEENTFSTGQPDIVLAAFPFPPVTSYDYTRGLLLNQKTKDAFGNIKKSLTNTYTLVPNYKQGAYAVGFSLYNHCYDGTSGLLVAERSQIVYATFTTTSEWVQKTTQQEDVYDTNGGIVSTSSHYYYDNPVHMQLTRTVTTKSNGKVITSVNTYPDDYAAGTTFLDDMKSHHVIAMPIEQATYQYEGANTSILGGIIAQYQTGGNGLIDKVYKLETPSPVALANYKFSNSTTGQLSFGITPGAYSFDTRYKQRLMYNQYDNLGNPLMYTQSGGAPTSYQWGYNHTYPVAQVSNAPVNDIFYDSFEEGNGTSSFGDAKSGHYSYNSGTYTKSLNGLDAGSYILSYWQKNSSNVWILVSSTVSAGTSYTITLSGQIDDVRFYPANALMTTYTYDPLTGLTSTTDAKGEITFYEYDSFQRLMNIKDKDGHIIKHMDYHYQGQ